MIDSFNTNPGQKSNHAVSFRGKLGELFGTPFESQDELNGHQGVEWLRAEPTNPLDLCPDAIGLVSVDLPLPGQDMNGFPRVTVHQTDDSTATETVFYDDGAAIYARSLSKKRGRDSPIYQRGGMWHVTVPLHLDEPEIRQLSPPEADTLLDWLGTVVPKPRRRPISLVQAAKLSQQTEATCFDLQMATDADKLEMAIGVQFATQEAPHPDDSIGMGLELLNRKVPDIATEITGTQEIRLTRRAPHVVAFDKIAAGLDDPVKSKWKSSDVPSVTLQNGSSCYEHAVTVYPEDGSVWMRRGPETIESERITVALWGKTIMDCVTSGTRGEMPIRLNSKQVNGVVEMILTAEPEEEHTFKRWG